MVAGLFWTSFAGLYNFPQIYSSSWRVLILCLALPLQVLTQNDPSSIAQIVPKAKAPGVDFCGVDEYYYIVRSDLGYYMKSSNFNKGSNLQVFSLHSSCRGGDHYLAHEDDLFYIIKGDHYRRVSNMNQDKDAIIYILHPNCRGGDHYLSAFGHFYIIFQEKGVYRKVKNLSTDEGAVEYTLHPDCKDGLYYWGTKNNYYFVKPHDKGGAQYYRTTNFHENLNSVTYSFHADVVNFLPGGLGITQGISFGKWEAIKTISNDRDSPITWSKKITRKVGYTKQEMKTIERNWKVSRSTSVESQENLVQKFLRRTSGELILRRKVPEQNLKRSSGELSSKLAEYQFSLSIEYGGSQVNTDEEQWSEATEVEEAVSVTLKPKEKMYIWQYQLGLGQKTVLFCKSMKFTNDSETPTENPLPPSKA